MASASMLNQGNLLPFRIYDEHDVIPFFSLDGTGLNGQFVAVETGNQDPNTMAGGYTQNPVAAAYTNVISFRYQTFRKVRPVVSGDISYNTIGVTLHTTAEFDENGNRLINWPQDRITERGFVLSGFNVPILTRGVITLRASNYSGIPIPGYAICVSNTLVGGVDIVNPTSLSAIGAGNYSNFAVVGKVLSTSGVAFGGYAQFKVQL